MLRDKSNWSKYTIYGLLLAIVAVFFQIRFGVETLNPSNYSWFISPEHDFMNVFLQTQYYLHNQAESFPAVWGLRYPSEFSPIYTNIMWPVLVGIKMFFPDTMPFQHFGIWYLICFILQGFGSYWAFGKMGVTNKWLKFIGSLFMLSTPFWHDRFEHVSFYPHWILIIAIGLYFAQPTTKGKYIPFVLLACFSSSIQPYMALMVFSVFSASVLQSLLTTSRREFYISLAYLVLSIVLSLLIFYLLGYRPSDTSQLKVPGFGIYNSNLNWLFNNQGKTFLPLDIELHHFEQYEGYGYIGGGLLLGLLVLLVRRNKFTNSVPRNAYLPIFLGTGILALYALLGKISFNQFLLIDDNSKFLGDFANQFRTNGRFIWPITYLLMMLVIAKLFSQNNKSTIMLACILLIIQIIDIHPLIKNAKTPYPPSQEFNASLWSDLFSHTDKVIIYPMYTSTLDRHGDVTYFVFEASKSNTPITAGFYGRGGWTDIIDYGHEVNSFINHLASDEFNQSVFIVANNSAHLLKNLDLDSNWMGFTSSVYTCFIHDSNEEALAIIHKYNLKKVQIQYNTLSSFLQSHKNKLIAIVAKDEATYKLGNESKEYTKSIGLNLHNLQFRHSYAALMYEGRVLFEEMGAQCIDTLIKKENLPLIKLISSGAKLDCEDAYITFGNKKSEKFSRGLKILAFDMSAEKGEEAEFDTYLSSYQIRINTID